MILTMCNPTVTQCPVIPENESILWDAARIIQKAEGQPDGIDFLESLCGILGMRDFVKAIHLAHNHASQNPTNELNTQRAEVHALAPRPTTPPPDFSNENIFGIFYGNRPRDVFKVNANFYLSKEERLVLIQICNKYGIPYQQAEYSALLKALTRLFIQTQEDFNYEMG